MLMLPMEEKLGTNLLNTLHGTKQISVVILFMFASFRISRLIYEQLPSGVPLSKMSQNIDATSNELTLSSFEATRGSPNRVTSDQSWSM